MNFQNHYFREEESLQEAPLAKKVAAAVGTGVGRAALNVLRGATGRMKTIAFEPAWLKFLKPLDYNTYKQTIDTYASWRNKKTKLGPKQTYTIKDMRRGVLGEFSKDDFKDILSKYDPSMENIDMDAEIKPEMSVYILNNGGKIIFMSLPVGPNGKKRKFALGLDNKAERAFALIHGMTIHNYTLTGEEEDTSKQVSTPGLKKVVITKQDFIDLSPKMSLVKSSNDSFDLFDLFNEEILEAKGLEIDGKRAVIKAKDGKWYRFGDDKKVMDNVVTKFKDREDLIAVNIKGEPDEGLQKELDNLIKDVKETDDKYGKLYIEIKKELKDIPIETKGNKTRENGFLYELKNGGKIHLYQDSKDKKYYIGYDAKAEEIVDKYKLLKKYLRHPNK